MAGDQIVNTALDPLEQGSPRDGGKQSVHLNGDWRIFHPTLDESGVGMAKLYALAELSPTRAQEGFSQLAASIQGETTADLKLRAAALVLRDLLAMGWGLKVEGGFIKLTPGTAHDGQTKEATRRQLEFGHMDQLREPSTRRFLINLERPGKFSSCRPVTDLIADGRSLARQLKPIAELPRTERPMALREVCRPYLQLVEGETRDEHTGLRLTDIWRYFRHTWATRYRSTPGRNLFFLIRDAAQPFHPVMGITALGNAVMQSTTRDKTLGWTLEGLKEMVQEGELSAQEVLASFRHRLAEDFHQVYREDLPVAAGFPEMITEDLLDQLQHIEEQAGRDRVSKLKEDALEAPMVPQRIHDVTTVDLEAQAKIPLFRAKRARVIKELLKSYDILKETDDLLGLMARPDGIWAVNQAIRQVKKQYSATAMMEITVCGGVAPYNQLLGGKLACLMMASPSVVANYSQRYDEGYSIIASQMAGRPIIKEPTLVFLATSSLYSDRSSQYNRVAIPAGVLPRQAGKIWYEELGVSEGFGSPNLSQEAEAALNDLLDVRSYRNVNFVFGEGQSPKLRQLREGFSALGLNRANLLNHGSPRIIYGVHLATNSIRYLLGMDSKPNYILPQLDGSDEAIAEFWRARWLASRLDHRPALEAVGNSTPLSERVSRLIPDAPRGGLVASGPMRKKEGRPMAQATPEEERIAFIRQLYRDESAYSDHVPAQRLRELNVKTKLDSALRKMVQAGASVVITGNAGDGKTHTIRLLESDLKGAGARVVVDASELTHDQVVETWEEARREGRPFCIAINEGPLVELIRAHRDAHPWLAEVHHKLLQLVHYVPVDQEEDHGTFSPVRGETYVVDLSLRSTLAADLVKLILEKLTDDKWYAGCELCSSAGNCPVKYNRTLLRNPRVQERVVDLMRRVAERGLRATFREMLAFTSYMIFGGRSCMELVKDGALERSRYYWNAFEGQGAIFENLEAGLDPVRQTSPKVDESLWFGCFDSAAFAGDALAPAVPRNLDSVLDQGGVEGEEPTDLFAALKRRWFFEHDKGRLLHSAKADQLFLDLQDGQSSLQLRVGRLIALINGWWNLADRKQQDDLRLWTQLSFSPRPQGRARVSGRSVAGLNLALFRPQLAPALRGAFGPQAIDHLLLAPPDNLRYANLKVDRALLQALLTAGGPDQDDKVKRRLTQFNDALSRHASPASHVRMIEILDPDSEQSIRLRVDLNQHRYDSAQ